MQGEGQGEGQGGRQGGGQGGRQGGGQGGGRGGGQGQKRRRLNIASSTCSGLVDSGCKTCVEDDDTWCAANTWDDLCSNICGKACVEECKEPAIVDVQVRNNLFTPLNHLLNLLKQHIYTFKLPVKPIKHIY